MEDNKHLIASYAEDSPFIQDCLEKRGREWTFVSLPKTEAPAQELPFGELPAIEVNGWEDGEPLPPALYNGLFFTGGGSKNKYFHRAWNRELKDKEGTLLSTAEHLVVLSELCYRRRASDPQTLGVLADWLWHHSIDVGFSGVPALMEEGLSRLLAFRQREASRKQASRTKARTKKPLQMPVEGNEPHSRPLTLKRRVLATIPTNRPIKSKDLTLSLGIDRRALARVLKAEVKNGRIEKTARGQYRKVGVPRGRAA